MGNYNNSKTESTGHILMTVLPVLEKLPSYIKHYVLQQ